LIGSSARGVAVDTKDDPAAPRCCSRRTRGQPRACEVAPRARAALDEPDIGAASDFAAADGRIGSLRWLAAQGAAIDRDIGRRTPLFRRFHRATRAVEFISTTAPANAPDHYGDTR
jgi:hypothetical protein